jgi:hypothetical protein
LTQEPSFFTEDFLVYFKFAEVIGQMSAENPQKLNFLGIMPFHPPP